MTAVTTLPRSFLYVPAIRPELFEKAHRGAAEAIVLDLEDAVPLSHKDEARAHVRDWFTRISTEPAPGAQVWVRVSAELLEDDLDAALHPGISGLLSAKSSPEVLQRLDTVATSLEHERGLSAPVGVVALIETAASLVGLAGLARLPRVRTFGIGEVDLFADLRVRRAPGTDATVDALRSEVVRHAAAAGLEAPVAPTSTDFRDLDAFAASTRHLVDLGFRSRTAVHPAQVPVVNEVLTPDQDTLDRARRVLALAESAGGGVTVGEDGRLIDAAVVREARETISRA